MVSGFSRMGEVIADAEDDGAGGVGDGNEEEDGIAEPVGVEGENGMPKLVPKLVPKLLLLRLFP